MTLGQILSLLLFVRMERDAPEDNKKLCGEYRSLGFRASDKVVQRTGTLPKVWKIRLIKGKTFSLYSGL